MTFRSARSTTALEFSGLQGSLEAEAREATKQREAEAQRLQKLQDKELKAAARL
ncbi:hypothetical protein BU23DRAFT_632994, partial [Bimuria novae-zelandiae CBS 107.79]